MILADTSVWVGHLREHDPVLADLLEAGDICQHPLVVGELACGNLKNRAQLIHGIASLPLVCTASDEEVMTLLTTHRLFGTGLGWVDVHLLASALLTRCRLYTLDVKLRNAAVKLHAAYLPASAF